uniref:Uncharacterized protein n=1 Tax=Arundo donax TaxID=35708 RepID=A0A0A8YPP1_ARUDO
MQLIVAASLTTFGDRNAMEVALAEQGSKEQEER